MFEDRTYKRRFYSAPQRVRSLVAAFLEPGITVATFLAVNEAFDQWVTRPELTLCMLVFALTFPGRDRFRDKLLNGAVDITSAWIVLLSVLLLCGCATRSLHSFETPVLLTWALATPLVQWLAMWIGRSVLRRRLSGSGVRRSAVVVGTGAFGVKVVTALTHSADDGVDFAGYFDARNDSRAHPTAAARRLGPLKDLAPYITEHGIREVSITLPLGSQPHIVELLEQVQGTTASLFLMLTTARWFARPSATTRAPPASAPSCGAARSTSCRSSTTCCKAQ